MKQGTYGPEKMRTVGAKRQAPSASEPSAGAGLLQPPSSRIKDRTAKPLFLTAVELTLTSEVVGVAAWAVPAKAASASSTDASTTATRRVKAGA